jgi:SAM-dependent methyltransferase
MAVAERHLAGVAALELTGSEQVLEIGCGHGVATRLLLDRLAHGRVTALDRSAKMIAAVEAAASESLAEGRLLTIARPLEDVDWGGRRFDGILAVNVDLELRLAGRWAPLLQALLAPGGRIVLSFEAPPGSTRAATFRDRAAAQLAATGLRTVLLPAPSGLMLLRARAPYG